MKQLELFEKHIYSNVYSDNYHRNFSLFHMFSKGLIIPDALIRCIPEFETIRLKQIKKHNEEIGRREKESNN